MGFIGNQKSLALLAICHISSYGRSYFKEHIKDVPRRYFLPLFLSSFPVDSDSLTGEMKFKSVNSSQNNALNSLSFMFLHKHTCHHYWIIMWMMVQIYSYIIYVDVFLTLQRSMVPGINTHSSSKTPSAVIMLFFTLSLRFKVLCIGANVREVIGLCYHKMPFRDDKTLHWKRIMEQTLDKIKRE